VNKRLRVLIIEDSEDDAALLARELRRGGYDLTFERVETADAMQAALDSSAGPGQTWDLVIADYALPHFSGPAALALLQARGLDLPFIVVSGSIGEDRAVDTLKTGAHDFVVKGQWARLAPAVERELRDAEVRRARRQAENELRAAEAKYRALVEQLPGIVYGLTFGETVWTSYISPQVETLLGFTPAEWLADPELWIKQLHPDDRERVLAEIGKSGSEGRPLSVEYRVLTRDGRVVWFHNRATVVLDEAGRPLYSYGIMFDITERKRAEDEVRRHAARAEALARNAARLNAQLNLEAVLSTVCEETARALNVSAVSVGLYEPSRDAIQIAFTYGLPPDYRQHHKPVPRSIFEQHVRVGEPLVVLSDVQTIPDLPNHTLYVRHNLRTIATASLLRGGGLVGTLNVYAFHERRDFDPDDLALLTALADQVAQAIANARLFEEAERRLQHVEALRAIDVSITGSMDLRLSLNVVLGQVLDQLRVDAADVLLLDRHAQALDYAAGRGFHTDAITRAHVRLGEGYAGLAALERRTIRIPDWSEEEPDLRRAAELAGQNFQACFVIPLVTKGSVRGVLEVFHRQPLHPDQEWLDFLEALAGQAALAIDNASLFNDLQRSNVDLTLAYDTTLEGWSRALDLRDKETEGHTQRVTELTLRLASAAGMGDDELVNVRRGALLHDIGKMGIPDRILLKPGPLTEEEWVIMRKHPVYAYELLTPIPFLRSALDIPYCHHEKWDGTGYPRGLRGELIPLAARLFAVVDVWDALRADRPYRPAWPAERVREHIRAGAGTHFDPHVVEIFMEMNR
jgi:PAS domain S-box-containing protein